MYELFGSSRGIPLKITEWEPGKCQEKRASVSRRVSVHGAWGRGQPILTLAALALSPPHKYTHEMQYV